VRLSVVPPQKATILGHTPKIDPRDTGDQLHYIIVGGKFGKPACRLMELHEGIVKWQGGLKKYKIAQA